MPATKDTETNDGEGGLSKRVPKQVREADFVYQGRARERGSSKKRMMKGRHAQEPLLNRLVEIELDAVKALADFSRLAHMPSQRSPIDLKWSAKRKRSTRSYDASSVKVEPQDTHVPINNGIPFGDSQRSERDSMTSLSHGDKVSPPFDSRAESPSSPLPSSNLACRTFLLNGGLSSKSAFQRVARAEPMQKPCLTSIKTEMEDLQSESLPPGRQKPRTNKASVSLCLVKAEPLGEQEEECKDARGAGAKALANLASQLVELSYEVGRVVLNKPKVGLSEEDKEARRLRRIQANRESARQTIRKKQILCEELRRQAASLASENEGMKQKKEALMQELYFLKGQNYHLKAELEMGPSCKLEPGMPQHSQGIPISSSGWQAPSLPYRGFPLHVFGWPRMMAQAGAANYADWPNKVEISEEHFGNGHASDDSMQRLSTVLFVQGIPVSSSMCVTGGAEQKGSCIANDTTSSPPHEESGAAATETLKSSGASCDVDSATSNDQQGLEKEVDVISLTKPAHGNAMQERGTLCRPTAIAPFRGDGGLGEKQSKSRASENSENHMGMPLTCGSSSCTGSIGSIPMNELGLADMYGRRTTQRTAAAAAEARKRRMELTRKKRSWSKRSKLVV